MPKLRPSRCLDALPALALALIFGWATWERFRLQLTPFANPDVWAYLGPGLDALLGEPFREWFGQCLLYPWLLYVLLKASGTFKCMTLVESLLGLGTGGVMFWCWMELGCFVPVSGVRRVTFELLWAGFA